MSYDVAFRHQQALDPSALSSVTTTLHAIGAAITDCRNAGKDAEIDPAVILLIRHLSQVCEARPPSTLLRRECLDAIAEIRRHPVLKTLAYRGVAYDEPAKRLFHSEGRIAVRRLAEALGLAEGSFDVRSNKGGVAVSGEITLHGEDIWVQLSLGLMGPDREILYRRVHGRSDHIGERNHYASIRDLMAPDRFARKIRRDLNLAPATPSDGRLFA
ncbi:hypothetical protein CJD35_19065 (plasmid) [Sphingobium xenophagum]|jgi:hypothetical protein|uniref:Uncharacterized protein n=1 Tax=Sphingobium xenophagum TaxID=121428 RepID=A0A249MZM2_SPHXE|nr:hypothetical protein [Sphingobium xenophagum]ASY46579.1 hypothetical protein CJD35_19065 [Sphingobium xenophagum]MBJ7441326.1 hypothetical protein [Sphingopyxis sp.]